MERIFALYDSDIFYATRFMEYFKKRKDFGFEMAVFTSRQSLDEYLAGHRIEILLLGDQAAAEDINEERIKYIYRLTDKVPGESEAGCPLILRYQAVQSVMSEIIADYQRRENEYRNISNPKQVKIISIYSPVLNLETLAFAWSAGSILSEQKKVLLVLLELFPIQLINSNGYSNQSLTDFIYYLKENNDIISKMKSLLSYQGNLSYLGGAANGADILAMGKEDVQKWIVQMRSNTDYQAIVFYLGGYSEGMAELMNQSNVVLVTGRETFYEKALLQELTKQMEKAGINMDRDKYKRIQLPEENGIRNLPISALELTCTASWNFAKQNLQLF